MSIATATRRASMSEIIDEMDRRGNVIEELEAKLAALAQPSPEGRQAEEVETLRSNALRALRETDWSGVTVLQLHALDIAALALGDKPATLSPEPTT